MYAAMMNCKVQLYNVRSSAGVWAAIVMALHLPVSAGCQPATSHSLSVINESGDSVHAIVQLPAVILSVLDGQPMNEAQLEKEYDLKPGDSETLEIYQQLESGDYVEGAEGPSLQDEACDTSVGMTIGARFYASNGGAQLGASNNTLECTRRYLTIEVVWDGKEVAFDSSERGLQL